MIGLKSTFPSNSLEDWIVQLKKDLKGDDFSKLLRQDEIEEIEFPTYHHAESGEIVSQVPGKYPFTRGLKTSKNGWNNGHVIVVTEEKIANLKALELLMKGCDLLIFDLSNLHSNDWANLFEGIQYEYITAQFKPRNSQQFESLKSFFHQEIPKTIQFNCDFLEHEDTELFEKLVNCSSQVQFPFCLVDGFSVQQAGATTWQEIAFCLSSGHHYLNRLIQAGFTIDQAAACIHFSIGIGSNYFMEIAKIRALKQVWAAVIKEYAPVHTCTFTCAITANIGWTNKSLLDPHTNLLRQTTEVMSAISGGIDTIVVHPYDSISSNGTSVLSERMALNIPLILKEESYFDGVIDPLGGSYVLEELTQKIARKAWLIFQSLEEKGGIFKQEAQNTLAASVLAKAELKTEEIRSGKKTLIGINKYPNNSPESNYFLEQKTYLGMQQLIFERALIAIQ
jgi:methylmalonyl-CoA mutase